MNRQMIKRFLIVSLFCYISYSSIQLLTAQQNDLLVPEGGGDDGFLQRFQIQPLDNNHGHHHHYHRELAIPKLEITHPFMRRSHPDLTPLVIPEFKLIMVTIPKVGCTEWNRLARVMMGYEDDLEQRFNHIPEMNGLTYLSDFSLEEAESMLLDKQWTKAVFLRDPMERILSAFLDKSVKSEYFTQVCCDPYLENNSDSTLGLGLTKEEGQKEYDFCKRFKGDFIYFLLRTEDCSNMHWSKQYQAVGNKWWPYIDFVGNMDRAEEDARTLLESLVSEYDGQTAWEKYGKTGWGKQGDRTKAFLEKDTAPHQTGAKDRMRKFYTRCAEAFVKDRWEGDYNSPHFQFHPIKLFHPQVDLEKCNFTMEKFKETVANLDRDREMGLV